MDALCRIRMHRAGLLEFPAVTGEQGMVMARQGPRPGSDGVRLRPSHSGRGAPSYFSFCPYPGGSAGFSVLGYVLCPDRLGSGTSTVGPVGTLSPRSTR